MSLVKWVAPNELLHRDEVPRLRANYVPVIPMADLMGVLCASCKAGLPYKNGFHSGHPKSRDYFKACEADALLGAHLEAHRKEGT